MKSTFGLKWAISVCFAVSLVHSDVTARVQKGVESRDMSYYMLPKTLLPVHQLVRLQPYLYGNYSIEGYTEFTFEVIAATSNITLHMVDIITKNQTIRVEETVSGSSIPILTHAYDVEREFYICTLGQELVVGQTYTLFMEFTGYLNDDLLGFYRSSYVNLEGDTVNLAVSQFAPTMARLAFPCFDEPEMKANFTIQLAREEHMVAVSNMPKATTEPIIDLNGWYLDTFETSVKMSTYLVAFLISDFISRNSSETDVWFRVWIQEAAIGQANYSLDIGPKILANYEEYFNISYPLPKQDMAAIPDFYYGAMENWGLITYREAYMLYHPELSSASDQQGVCRIVAHELAHQWFGNLVTFKWWNDVWLNEGFATYLEYPGCDSVEPTFRQTDLFTISDMHYIFQSDALESSHPVDNPIDHPDDLNYIYDSIAYSKGASIIRMMNYFLTEPTFQAGLQKYLDYFSYSNAESDDLWFFLTNQAHADGNLHLNLTVKTIMDTWTLQMGYPVLNVTINTDGTAFLTQERFLMDPEENSTDTHDYKWWIPVSYVTQSNPDFTQYAYQWMSPDEAEKTITGLPPTTEWAIFNTDQAGYYRVNYEANNWNLIAQQLDADYSIIGLLNRAQILDDCFNLAKAGRLTYDTPLDIGTYLGGESDYVPISAGLGPLDYIDDMFASESGYGSLKSYLESILVPLYNDIGFEDDLSDPHLDQMKRSLVLSWSCRIGHEPCLNSSINLFSQWMANPNNNTIISPNQKSTVYCSGIAEGGEEEWNFAYDRYLNVNNAGEKDRLLVAMGCSSETWILSRYLDLAFSNVSGIRKQDVSTVIASVSNNIVGESLAWDYIVTNDDEIASYMGSYLYVASFVDIASRNFNTELELYELTLFKQDNLDSLGTNTQAVDQAIERTEDNIAWMDNYYDIIIQWFIDNGYN